MAEGGLLGAFAVLVSSVALVGCGARSELEEAPLTVRATCATLHAAEPTAPTDAYELETDGLSWRAFCDMDTDGGGWTLVLKADGRLRTFGYDAAIWTQGGSFGAPDEALEEAIFAGYERVAMTEVRLVLVEPVTGNDSHAVHAQLAAGSLADAVKAGFLPLGVARSKWLSLVPGAILQKNCNVAGVDARGTASDHARVRLGIVANQEDDCSTPDSFVGVGGDDFDAHVTTGAFCDAFWCKPGATLEIPRFAFVFVR